MGNKDVNDLIKYIRAIIFDVKIKEDIPEKFAGIPEKSYMADKSHCFWRFFAKCRFYWRAFSCI